MDTEGFQKELGVIPDDLLHAHAEDLIVICNRKAADAKDHVMPMHCLPTCGSHSWKS